MQVNKIFDFHSDYLMTVNSLISQYYIFRLKKNKKFQQRLLCFFRMFEWGRLSWPKGKLFRKQEYGLFKCQTFLNCFFLNCLLIHE